MKQLDDLLSEIGRERREQMTPPPMRAAAMPSRRRSAFAWVAAAAAALAAVFALMPQGVSGPAPAPVETRRVQVEPAPTAPVATPVVLAVKPPEPVQPRLTARRQRPVSVRPAEWRTQFVTVPGADALPEPQAAAVLRVEVSTEALPGYGILTSGAELPSTVRADLLIGDDGLARAIRLVQ